MSHLRPLLPATSAGSSGQGGGAPGPRAPLAPKRKNVDAACLACKKRKVRCDGQEPRCAVCVKRGLLCEYSPTENQSSKVIKRKLTDIEERLQAHEELYSIMQSKSEEECLSIIRRIKSVQDVRTVLRHLQDGDLLLQIAHVPQTWHQYSFPFSPEMPHFLRGENNPYLEYRIYEMVNEDAAAGNSNAGLNAMRVGFEAQYRAPYHAATLIEPRIDALRPSQWTQVPVNDNLLCQLLKMYFMRVYPTSAFFHNDYFLDDMAADREKFCSSYLHAYIKDPQRTEFWNPHSLQYQFLAETRRIREFEDQKDSLTAVQATLVLALTYNMNSMDEIGFSYTIQAIAMADRIKLFDEFPPKMEDKIKASRTLTAWTTFNFQALFSFHFFRPPLIKSPPRFPLLDPKDNASWYPELWIMYPLAQSPIPIDLGHHFKAVSESRALVNKIGACAFPTLQSQKKLTLDEAWGFYLMLKKWYDELPSSLSPRNAVLPFQLLVHLRYFNIVIILLEPFATAETQGRDPESTENDTANYVVADAKMRFETVSRLYYLRHGFETYDPLLIQFHILLGFMTLNTLSSGKKKAPEAVKALQSTLVLALKGLRDQANSCYLAVTTFSLLKGTLKQGDPRLLQSVADVEQDKESVKTLIASHVKSQYPINVVSMSEDPEQRRVGALIAAYKELELDDTIPFKG
ncbi:n-terminal fungal transcription regulatory domain protein [Fusarium tjaetaba]|uniref:N-terminal fungal transcription regulatory domain protein n=1 Tax=Fusarium tjaetaba TaxID=1567544 RepID=A0A8H5R338_9HYPO|nr:n-terminal fungal transcription regulatory domain protein [Fusarium tjaetaba]KAF5625839.1 n-terminal fungal transcription regulatory domain protein [Fusarium tjaetaba]